jgi:AraC-like DNA-binding protein
MRLFIHYSPPTVYSVLIREIMEKVGLDFAMDGYSEIEIKGPVTPAERERLSASFAHYGIELIDGEDHLLVHRIKEVIREIVYSDESKHPVNVSDHISKKLNYSYGHLSSIFSEATSMSIAHYAILEKVERIKDLIITERLALTEISYRMNYSSVAHLSNQFKKITGLTPKQFKEIMNKRHGSFSE